MSFLTRPFSQYIPLVIYLYFESPVWYCSKCVYCTPVDVGSCDILFVLPHNCSCALFMFCFVYFYSLCLILYTTQFSLSMLSKVFQKQDSSKQYPLVPTSHPGWRSNRGSVYQPYLHHRAASDHVSTG